MTNAHTVRKNRAEERARVVHTNLYDLVAAVSGAVAPGEEELVPVIVADMLRRGRVRLSCGARARAAA